MKTIRASLLLLCATIPAHAQFTSPLATGVRLDPAGQSMDFRGPDRIDDARFNQLLWLMMKGDRPMPAAQSRPSLHLLQISR